MQSPLCHLLVYLEPVGLSTMYKSFIWSCLKHGHLFYFGVAKSHLDHLDALQHQAAGICHHIIPSLESRWHAAAIGLTYRQGHDDLVFYSCYQDIVSPIYCLAYQDIVRALKLNNPVTFKSLNSFCRS